MGSLLRLVRAALLLATLFIAGCASTPQASPQQDALAKEFLTHPGTSTIYVYRSWYNHYDTDTVLYVDGRLIGSTLPGAFYRLDINPGRHILHGNGIDIGELALDTRPGQIYFVELNVNAGHSNFRVMPEERAKQEVRACCALMETWSPGQRPFLLR